MMQSTAVCGDIGLTGHFHTAFSHQRRAALVQIQCPYEYNGAKNGPAAFPAYGHRTAVCLNGQDILRYHTDLQRFPNVLAPVGGIPVGHKRHGRSFIGELVSGGVQIPQQGQFLLPAHQRRGMQIERYRQLTSLRIAAVDLQVGAGELQADCGGGALLSAFYLHDLGEGQLPRGGAAGADAVYFGLGALDMRSLATGAFELAIELNPSNVNAWGRLADMYARAESDNKAIWAYQNVLKLADEDIYARQVANANKMMSQHLYAQGNSLQAAKLYNSSKQYYDSLGINRRPDKQEVEIIEIIEAHQKDDLTAAIQKLLNKGATRAYSLA